jgi:serine/threonine protein phosphatase PrpC
MSSFSFILEVGKVYSAPGRSPMAWHSLLSFVVSLAHRFARGSPFQIAIAPGVEGSGFLSPSLVLYLAPLVTGLLILIAVLVLIRLSSGGVRAKQLREGIQESARSPTHLPLLSPICTAADEPMVQLTPGRLGSGQAEETRSASPSQAQPLSSHLSLAVGALSHPGIKRQRMPNEDSLFAVQGIRPQISQPQPFGLFIVADGMGGHMYGQEASRLGIQTMIDQVLPRVSGNGELNEADFRRHLIDGAQRANYAIYQRNKAQRTEMGTTITAVLIINATALVVNVGDSRTYLYRKDEGLRKVTKDHSLVAYLVEAGIIQPDDIYNHPQRNQIYRSLGAEQVIPVDSFREQLQPGDTLLLCSDGLWEMVRDPLIQQILRKGADPSQTSNTLLHAALDGGGADNVSMIVIQVTQATGSKNMTGMQLLAKPETIELPNMSQREPNKSSQ